MAKKNKENKEEVIHDADVKEKVSLWQRIKNFFMKFPGIRQRVYDNQDYKKQMAEYKYWEKHYKAAEEETIRREVEIKNKHLKEINAIIKKEGSYDEPGVHLEKPLKLLDPKEEIAKRLRQKPQKDNSWRSLGLFAKFSLRLKKMWHGVKQFFANLRLNGFKTVPIVESPDYKAQTGETIVKQGTMAHSVLAKQMGNEEHSVDGPANEVVDIKTEFDQWAKTEGVTDRKEGVFDFLKLQTMSERALTEQEISDLLSSVYGYACAYDTQLSEITVLVPNEENQPCFYTIRGNGEIYIPETIEYDNQIVHNTISEKTTTEIPNSIAKISKNLEDAPILLSQISDAKGFANDSLMQARAFVTFTDCHVYDKHIIAAEESIKDEEILKSLNKYMVTASYFANINPVQALELAIISPATTMTKMEYPQQYDIVFECATDFLRKGCDVTSATKLSELYLIQTENGLGLISPEARKEIQNQVSEFIAQGVKPKDIVSIMGAYAHTDSVEQLRANKEFVDSYLANGVKPEELAKNGIKAIDLAVIVVQIEKEMETKSAHDIQSDIESKGNETITASYISTFSKETLATIAGQLSPEKQGDFRALSGISEAEVILATDGAAMPEESTGPTVREDTEQIK